MIKILHLIPEIPVPTTSGGKVVFLGHMKELASTPGLIMHTICVDADGDREAGAAQLKADYKNFEVFPRATPRLGSGWRGKISALDVFIRSSFPRAFAARNNVAARSRIVELMKGGDVDMVIADHLTSMAMMPPPPWPVPVVIINHNVEQTILHQQASLSSFPLNLALSIDARRMAAVENKVIKAADLVVTLTPEDAAELSDIGAKTRLCPYIIPPVEAGWHDCGNQDILFVGSLGYFPNREAIEWMVHELAPALEQKLPPARLLFAGAKPDDVPKDWPVRSNTVFLGRVSDEHLASLHRESALYCCPMRYGSGIKIKILDAASYGMPILCSAEGRSGISWLPNATLIDRTDPAQLADKIAALLADRPALQAMAGSIKGSLGQVASQRNGLLGTIIRDIVKKGKDS
ncbi:glycosyltransferase [Niveispirillum irakense]|uniref:glycosyltransferase n=1 Tax=Niveispirillum irakense TaxID=34011 RepID=UPI0003F978A1|nr:glycosyltransferase family 4 protein [Niveispirillum irakense]